MKVLVISHMYPSTFNNVFGIFVSEQVKALVKHGVNIKVISPVPLTPFPINRINEKWYRYSKIPKFENRDGISVYYPRYITFPKALFFDSSGERMYRGIKELIQNIYNGYKFDLVHAHAALPDGYAAMKIAKDFKVPFVVTIHGQDLYITINKNAKCKMIIQRVFEQAHRVMVVSNQLKRIAKNNIGLGDKTIIIGNGIPIDKIHHLGRQNINIGNKNIILLSVSYLIERKGIDFNLKAFSKILSKYPNLKYIIIGDGVEKKRLQDLAEKLGIYEKVEFLGMLSHEDVMKKMAEADIFSLPSWNEAFGVVYIEAMAHGKPVIGCKGEGIEDFVEDRKTGMLVNPKDTDSLVKAIYYLLSNPEEAKRIGERARRLVLEKYTWTKNAEKTIKVYQEALNNAK